MPDLMSALKASLDAVRERTDDDGGDDAKPKRKRASPAKSGDAKKAKSAAQVGRARSRLVGRDRRVRRAACRDDRASPACGRSTAAAPACAGSSAGAASRSSTPTASASKIPRS